MVKNRKEKEIVVTPPKLRLPKGIVEALRRRGGSHKPKKGKGSYNRKRAKRVNFDKKLAF